MTAEAFLDTNILVYAYDSSEPRKQAVAQELLTCGLEQESAVLSAQVLGEFFVVITRKVAVPMTPQEARSLVDLFCALPVVDTDISLVRRAIDTRQTYQLSYWDGLIIAAAERAGCRRILSEDLNSGQEYHGIRVDNPFSVEG
jgi:predicted nucleic acid-binding protein